MNPLDLLQESLVACVRQTEGGFARLRDGGWEPVARGAAGSPRLVLLCHDASDLPAPGEAARLWPFCPVRELELPSLDSAPLHELLQKVPALLYLLPAGRLELDKQDSDPLFADELNAMRRATLDAARMTPFTELFPVDKGWYFQSWFNGRRCEFAPAEAHVPVPPIFLDAVELTLTGRMPAGAQWVARSRQYTTVRMRS